MRRLEVWIAAYRRHRFACLFVTLLLTLVAVPLLETLGLGKNLVLGFLAVNLIAAILGALPEQGPRILVALGGLALLVFGGSAIFGKGSLLTAGQMAGSATALLALAAIAQSVFRSGPVDEEKIFSALGAYLLFGLVCGVAYTLVEQSWPGSFSLPESRPAASFQSIDGIYFSFVTLVSLGYGDIVPRTPSTQGLAIMEALVGQLYLVVLVARLVSLYSRPDRE